MDKAIRDMVKGVLGMSDEELDKLSPGIQRLLSKSGDLMSYKIIAEVVDSKNCFAMYKPGDKLVFRATNLLKEETTCEVCCEAIGSINDRIRSIMDRIVSGYDPNDSIFTHAECADTGSEFGGLGKVRFKVYAEKA